MVKVYVNIKLYIRVCVKEYVSLNIKKCRSNTVSVYKKLHCSMQQRFKDKIFIHFLDWKSF